jgi:hypothetical protein
MTAVACPPTLFDKITWDKYTKSFNKMPHIDKVADINVDALIDKMEKNIIDLNMQDYVAVHRVHKHFDMCSGEQLIMTDTDGFVTVKPMPISKDILPYMFALVDDSWIPIQFAPTDFPGLAESLQHIKDNMDKIDILKTQLIEMDMQNYLGLSVNYLRKLPMSYRDKIEDTYTNRTQLFKRTVDESSTNLVETWWTFDHLEAARKRCPRVCNRGVNGHEDTHTRDDH